MALLIRHGGQTPHERHGGMVGDLPALVNGF
jgi:hypothetical protein